ncbi:thioredoxin domain-containing protein [Schumannella sp. 10F1B-5-1]|uniref:DsbA family protein n=1 Tax=Schumannella sp. 10F1B-5-1 TaxID=2590780 RepID=UPI001130A7AC|nr:thioredoxin domain-containing protein [Schumannella sp. 10F1B-5-1]TPW72857.1 hypothetical protein FJ658_06235 [Schumannella sp. 10F1B-5-1]
MTDPHEPGDARDPDAAPAEGAPAEGAPAGGASAEGDALAPTAPATPPVPLDTAAIATAREAARDRASEIRTLQRKQDRRRNLLLRGGIVGGIIAVIVVVTLVIINFASPAQRGPRNMLSDGIRIGADLTALRTGSLGPGDTPVEATQPEGTIAIRLYVDYFQPDAAAFEKANSSQLRSWVSDGAATLEVHPVALSSKSGSDQYALRAANAAGCVAEYSPDRFFAFHDRLLKQQPTQESGGMSDARILEIAKAAKVTSMSDVTRCVESRRFGKWVQAASNRAINGPLPDSDVKAVSATPLVLLNGTQFVPSDYADPDDLARAFVQANGGDFTEDESASPSPSPSASPAG